LYLDCCFSKGRESEGGVRARLALTGGWRMTGSALQGDGRCSGIKKGEKKGGSSREGGPKILPDRKLADFCFVFSGAFFLLCLLCVFEGPRGVFWVPVAPFWAHFGAFLATFG